MYWYAVFSSKSGKAGMPLYGEKGDTWKWWSVCKTRDICRAKKKDSQKNLTNWINAFLGGFFPYQDDILLAILQ